MIALTLSLFLAAVPPQDVDKAKVDLKKAIANYNLQAVEDSVKRISVSDTKRSVDLLLEAYGECAKEFKSDWEDKLKVIQENQSAEKFDKALEAKGRAIEAKIQSIEGMKRLIVQALASFKSEGAILGLAGELKAKSFAGGDWTRRAGIAEALGQVGHPEALKALVESVFKDTEPQVRIAAMDGLRAQKQKTPEVVNVLILMLGNDSWQVKSTAVAALRALGAKESIENLVEALAKNDGRLRAEINEALIGFTGVDKHGDHAAWRAWWDANKEDVKDGIYKPRKDEAAGNAGAPTTFYGIPIKSKHVVFCLDRSGSMKEPSEWEIPADVATGPNQAGADIKPTGNRKIDIARWQLKKAIAMLPDGTEFDIIFFSNAWTAMSETMIKLNATTRKQAFEFIDSLEPTGRTNIFDPLERALMFAPSGAAVDKMPRSAGGPGKTIASTDRVEKGTADTVFLLTDGLPNIGQVPDPAGIIARIKELNRTRKVTINTVGVFSAASKETEGGLGLLKQLAEDSGGVFTAPGKKKP